MRKFGKLVVVPFEPWHLSWIDFNEDAARALEGVIQDMPNHGRMLATSSKAYTGLYKGRVLGCVGLVPWWPGMMDLWMYLGKDAFVQKKQGLKALRWFMEHLTKEMNLHRIQAVVKTDFEKGHRFAKFFGFKDEGVMEQYGPNKESFNRYAKII
jgi:RimJ/RimL family protein N-acetyltransferase